MENDKTSSHKSHLLGQEYPPSAVNVLTSSPKISDLTKNDFCKLNLAENDENVVQKSFSAGFSSF